MPTRMLGPTMQEWLKILAFCEGFSFFPRQQFGKFLVALLE